MESGCFLGETPHTLTAKPEDAGSVLAQREIGCLPYGMPVIMRGSYPLTSPAKFDLARISQSDSIRSRAERIIDAFRTQHYPTESCFAWLAAESRVARAIRRYLIDERGFDKRWIKAVGYWRSDAAGAHEEISDED